MNDILPEIIDKFAKYDQLGRKITEQIGSKHEKVFCVTIEESKEGTYVWTSIDTEYKRMTLAQYSKYFEYMGDMPISSLEDLEKIFTWVATYKGEKCEVSDGCFVSYLWIIPNELYLRLKNHSPTHDYIYCLDVMATKTFGRVMSRDPENWVSFFPVREISLIALDYYLWSICKKLTDEATNNIVSTIDAIAATSYERQEANGYMIFKKKGTVIKGIKFIDTHNIHNIKEARKIVQSMSSEQTLLLSGNEILGLETIDVVNEGECIIGIIGRYHWKVGQKTKIGIDWIFDVDHQGVSFEKGETQIQDIIERLEKSGAISKDSVITKTVVETSWPTIEAAFSCQNGCIVVIDTDAKAETNRLRNQCFRIDPCIITKTSNTNLLCVDGALLVDFTGHCHAYGAILDGQAKATIGDKARGSRFNSLIRYIDSRKGLAFGLVVSDDGNWDVIS